MKYEKVQKGNPRGLTQKQHIFPVKSISRFTNDSGHISVHLIKQNKVIRCKPNHEVFCVHRHWDQRAEAGYMKSIEDRFQALAESIVSCSHKKILLTDFSIINEMYALWYFRFLAKYNPIQDQKVTGIAGEKLTKDQEEILESKFCSYVRGDNSEIPGRVMTGIKLQIEMMRSVQTLRDISWSTARTKNLELIVPECFSTHAIIPLTPKLALVSDNDQGVISDLEVSRMNFLAINSSKEYYFARDLSKCF